MDGTRSDVRATPEASAEVQRVYGLLREAMDEELRRLAELMVSKEDGELLGRTEFQIRDHVLRMGAMALETTVNDRKKGGTEAAASFAPTATRTLHSRGGGRRRS